MWARQAGSANAYDTFFVLTYAVGSPAGCVAKSIGPNPAPPQPVGTSVTFTPSSSGCTGQRKFWLLPPGGAWTVVQAYGVGSTWSWNTAGQAPGVYEVGVWEGSSSAPSAYVSYAITSFTLGVPTCASATLAAGAPSPQPPGTKITFNATSTGCATPTYEFWLLAPGGSWAVARPYGTGAWIWDTNGAVPGTYQVGVWARQAGSTASYDAYFIQSFRIAGRSRRLQPA